MRLDSKVLKLIRSHLRAGLPSDVFVDDRALVSLTGEYIKDSSKRLFISVSLNAVEPEANAAVYYLRVSVAGSSINPMTSDYALDTSYNIIDLITEKELIFDMPEQFALNEMEETYFDTSRDVSGYVLIFTVSSSTL